MKIGILTFHYAHNYGAVLQAFALKKYLSDLGNDVSVINYKNRVISSKYKKKLNKDFRLSDINSYHNFKQYIKKYAEYRIEQKSWDIQFEKFERFIYKYLIYDSLSIDESDISNLDYDLIISGSDQLWNKYLTGGYDKIYFLQFETKAIKAFYAISDGNSLVTQDNYDYYSGALRNIKYISTREKSLADDIFLKTGKKAVGVVDPSFLLCKQDYISSFELKKTKEILFAYFIEEDPFMARLVRVISKALNLEIVELHYYKKRFLNQKYQRADLGPIDFLEGIYNADFVITNSFHGTAFSIIFHKQFYSVYNEDARKDNLLSELGLQRRKINCAIELDLNDKIDYNDVNIKTYVDSSKKFLDVVLKDKFSEVD